MNKTSLGTPVKADTKSMAWIIQQQAEAARCWPLTTGSASQTQQTTTMDFRHGGSLCAAHTQIHTPTERYTMLNIDLWNLDWPLHMDGRNQYRMCWMQKNHVLNLTLIWLRFTLEQKLWVWTSLFFVRFFLNARKQTLFFNGNKNKLIVIQYKFYKNDWIFYAIFVWFIFSF